MQPNCQNCNASLHGKFCSECGQTSHTHRITFASILHDIPHSVFHIDKGFFYTFIQLLYRPGLAIHDYLDGKRVKFFSPFAYLLLLSAASSFVRHQFIKLLHEHYVPNRDILFPGVSEFFNHYPAAMLCLLAPFISIWSWLFNRDKRYNYWENFILNIYIIAQFNLFFIVHNVLRSFNMYTSASVTPMLLCFMGYLTFVYIQFFKRKESFPGIAKKTIMFLLIAFTLITLLSLTGFMTPWWGNIK